MKIISFENALLPVPSGWSLNDNARSFSGAEGLLDPRIVTVESDIDSERLDASLERMRGKNGAAEIIRKGGVNHLFCSYAQSGCLVYTFTIPLSSSTELNAVYVFKPGNDVLAEEVRKYFTAT